MNRKARAGFILLVALLSILPVAAWSQDAAPVVPEPVKEATASALDQVLTFIDSASTYLGRGVLHVINLITNDRVSADLEQPIGYLAMITVILLLFGLLDMAKRIIWIGVIAGWALLVVRVVLDAIQG